MTDGQSPPIFNYFTHKEQCLIRILHTIVGCDAQNRQEHVDMVAARSAEGADVAVEREGVDQECNQR